MEKIKAMEMVRQIRDAEFEITKDMTNEELKEYYHREARSANEAALKLLKKQKTEK